MQPYESVTINLSSLRSDKTKDVIGNLLPESVDRGKIVWFEEVRGSLIGRVSMTNATLGVVSSFSCPNCNCPPWVINNFVRPSSTIDVVGGAGTPLAALMTRTDCSYAQYGPYEVFGATWYSSNPSVMSLTSSGNASCQTPGSATAYADWFAPLQPPDDSSPCETAQVGSSGGMNVYRDWAEADGLQVDIDRNVIFTQDQYNSLVGQGLMPLQCR